MLPRTPDKASRKVRPGDRAARVMSAGEAMAERRGEGGWMGEDEERTVERRLESRGQQSSEVLLSGASRPVIRRTQRACHSQRYGSLRLEREKLGWGGETVGPGPR
jgi:hypothetical protein